MLKIIPTRKEIIWDDEGRCNVQNIINNKTIREKREGFNSKDNSWEEEENIPRALIQEYFRVKSERRRHRLRGH